MLHSAEDRARAESTGPAVKPEGGQTLPSPSLESFIKDDPALLEAMEFFLLLRPEDSTLELGEPGSLKVRGDEARAAGDDVTARILYESAAKIALYRQRKDEFRDLLALAGEVTAPGDRFDGFHRTLLRELDEAVRVAGEFYRELGRLSGVAGPGEPERPERSPGPTG